MSSLSTVGLLKKAATSADTFLVLEPPDTEMATNIKYYRTNGIAYEDSKAREVRVICTCFLVVLLFGLVH